MGAYIVRRLLWTLLLLFVVSGLIFLIFYVLPSADPARLRAGRQPTVEAVEAIRDQLGLDDPLYVQYGRYMADVFLRFDFGTSFTNDADVRELIFDRLPASLFLVAGAVVVWVSIGLTVGLISAVKRGTFLDRFSMTTALVFISAPVYWLGLVALFLFSSDIGRFPLLPGSGAYQNAEGFLGQAGALVMPWFVLAAAFAAVYARLLRANMLEVLQEDYIRTARAKGVSRAGVILRHGMRAALTPVVTVLAIDVGVLFGGALLTETVFNIPGVGRLAYEAILRGDLVTVQGTTLFIALGVALMSLLADIAYSVLDPRVRLQ